MTIAYDGTEYQGWQIQPGKPTIQQQITDALRCIAAGPVTIHGAGRTDAGVHALGQRASFHLPCELADRFPCDSLQAALNGHLPADIRVSAMQTVAGNFHARFDAREKTYQYELDTARIHHPLRARFAWHYTYPLNPDLLRETSLLLMGTHDFTPFTVTSCETRTRVRTLTDFSLEADGGLLRLSFTGDGFLRYQVRRMVSTLLAFNRHRWQPQSFEEVVRLSEKTKSTVLAPAKGLTLMKVGY
jgi:tRNA pseudouridine38-40 synthase